MQGQSDGEKALKFGFNQGGDLQIEGYYLPRNSVSFTSDEVNAAYLQASDGSDELKHDVDASQLLQDFVIQTQGKTETLEVFTFDGHLPDYMGLTDRAGPGRDKNSRKLRAVHELDREKPCHKCNKGD
jgi:hypothetical protein